GATTTTPASFAAAPSAAVVGPGTGSARSKRRASSLWQKYGERKSSGRHTTAAPAAAASLIPASARSMLAAGSADMAICTSPTLNPAISASLYPPVRADLGLEVDDHVDDLGVRALQGLLDPVRYVVGLAQRERAVHVRDEVHVDGVGPAAGADLAAVAHAGHAQHHALQLVGGDDRAVGQGVEGPDQD